MKESKKGKGMEEYIWIESINDFIVNRFKEDPSVWTDLNSDGKNDSMCAKFEKNIFEDKENYTASHMSITKEDKPGAPEGIYIFNKKDKTYWKYTYSNSDITDKLVNQITDGYIRLLTQTYDRFAQFKLSKEAYLEYPLETEFLGSIYDTETIFDQINDYYIKEPNSDWEAHQINDEDKPFYIRKPDLPSGREITLEVSDDDDGYYIGIASEIISGSKLTIFSVPLKSKNWKAVANQIDDFAKTLLK